MASNNPVRVLFVCTGNICRSPLAEALFRQMVEEEGLQDRFMIESAGTTTYHEGERPHPGTQAVLKKNRVPFNPQKRAQVVRPGSLDRYDYLVAMDRSNVMNLRRWGGEALRLLQFSDDEDLLDVPDPYYEGNFDEVYDLIKKGLRGLLDHIRSKEGL